jgi:AraC-like DNA-binding protein
MKRLQQDVVVKLHRPAQLEGVTLVQIGESAERWSGFQKTWDVCLLTSGAADWRYRGQTQATVAGAVRLKEPGERFTTTRVEAAAGYMIMQVDPERFAALSQDVPTKHRQLAVKQLEVGREAKRLARLFGALAQATTTLSRSAYVTALVREALLPALEVQQGGSRERGWLSPSMKRAHDFLRAHFAQDISLGELAQLAGVHEVYLVRAFKRAYGLPPHQLQIELRVQAAQQLLDRGLQGAQVAAQVGFFDQSHLNRHFKRAFGVTPGHYTASYRPVGAPLIRGVCLAAGRAALEQQG